MASLTNLALAAQVPYEPAELPEPGKESVTTQEYAARTNQLRDPEHADKRNALVPIDHAGRGPHTGPVSGESHYDRPAMAADVRYLAPTAAEAVVNNIGSHAEQRPGADYQPGDAAPEPPFDNRRRNTFRLPPPPADQNLLLGD